MLISPRFSVTFPAASFAARLAVFRVKAIAVAGLLLILATGSFSQSAFAQSKCDCWINSKTGEAVPDYPYKADRPTGDPNRTFVPASGENYHRDQNCTWINSKTGEAVPGYPYKADRPTGDPNRTFVPASGENYHRVVPCPPPPVTTTPAPVGVGFLIVEPRVSLGLARTSGTSAYDSTGGQPSFSGDSSKTGGQFSGGVSIGTGVGGNTTVMVDFSVSTHPGQTFFSILRHADGLVTLDASSSVVVDALLKGQVAAGHSNNFFLSAGIGPSFLKSDITLTSNQTAFGGGMPAISESKWQTGWAVSAGMATSVCQACIAGNPLQIGVEGRARSFSSQSIGLTSPSFGFTETGSTGRTRDYSVFFTLSVPITLR